MAGRRPGPGGAPALGAPVDRPHRARRAGPAVRRAGRGAGPHPGHRGRRGLPHRRRPRLPAVRARRTGRRGGAARRGRRRLPGRPVRGRAVRRLGRPLRDQAREAYLRARRTLARLARRAGDTGAAVDHLLAILERDPYDEGAHRAVVDALVTAGRHGEARRAFDRYVAAMRSIGVPGPDPALLAPVRSVVGSLTSRRPAR
ncbi:bacterial transcriptional activator domain-containing protein [Luedemannella flava]